MAAVIQLRPTKPAKPKRKVASGRRMPTRRHLIEMLHAQASRAMAGDWTYTTELNELASLAKYASWKARSVIWRGIRFPLKRGLAIDSVRCPITDRPLVGVI